MQGIRLGRVSGGGSVSVTDRDQPPYQKINDRLRFVENRLSNEKPRQTLFPPFDELHRVKARRVPLRIASVSLLLVLVVYFLTVFAK